MALPSLSFLQGPGAGFHRARLRRKSTGLTVSFDINMPDITVVTNNPSANSPSSPTAGGNPYGKGGGNSSTARSAPTSSSSSTGVSGSGSHAQRPTTTQPSNSTNEIVCYFDGEFTRPVHTQVQILRNWVMPQKQQGSNTSTTPNEPPKDIEFWLGSSKWMVGQLTKVTAKYTHFLPTGEPCRAQVNWTMALIEDAPGKQNPTSGALATYSAVTMGAGDTLPSVAFKEYGRASLWRRLAEINQIDDPLRVAAGTMILLPNLTELVAGEG